MKKNKKKIFCVVGTRPEFIKMFPVYEALKKDKSFSVKFVLSSQHKELIESLGDFFGIKEDFKLDINQSEIGLLERTTFKGLINDGVNLSKLAGKILFEASALFAKEKPDLILVQGDTITVQQVALAAFYQKIPVAHIEAGLRTQDIYSPFPEEMARRIVSQIATFHFAPTKASLEVLDRELSRTINKKFFVVGNTVVDALKHTVSKIKSKSFQWKNFRYAQDISGKKFDLIKYLDENSENKIVLITAHRRENFDKIHSELAKALKKLVSDTNKQRSKSSVKFIVSLHKNPKAREMFKDFIGHPDFKLVESCNYPLFVKAMMSSHLILTDSGGIQEEAPYLEKPVLVFRKETERPEGLSAGVAELAGSNADAIFKKISKLLNDKKAHKKMIEPNFKLYGDGKSSLKIVKVIKKYITEPNGI